MGAAGLAAAGPPVCVAGRAGALGGGGGIVVRLAGCPCIVARPATVPLPVLVAHVLLVLLV
jgi:hypothetical protein